MSRAPTSITRAMCSLLIRRPRRAPRGRTFDGLRACVGRRLREEQLERDPLLELQVRAPPRRRPCRPRRAPCSTRYFPAITWPGTTSAACAELAFTAPKPPKLRDDSPLASHGYSSVNRRRARRPKFRPPARRPCGSRPRRRSNGR